MTSLMMDGWLSELVRKKEREIESGEWWHFVALAAAADGLETRRRKDNERIEDRPRSTAGNP